jgi:uncharacterized protein YodC (DUF2158 family)
MENGKLKIGDVVRLKSGGPRMTVVNIDSDDGVEKANYLWFPYIDAEMTSEEIIPTVCLTPVSTSPLLST